jgi:hypothetical protein
MKSAKSALLVSVFLAAAAALCQEPTPAPPKPPDPARPALELMKLGYFAGLWRTEAETREEPPEPPGRVTSTDNCEWFAGRFHLVCRSFGKGPSGEFRGLGILGYDAEENTYTQYGIDSLGMTVEGRGRIEGKTWTFTSESQSQGKAVSTRYVVTEQTPKEYVFKYETSSEGGPWTTVLEGKSTKIGSRPSPGPTKKPR